jgi:hypothetical protein
MNSCKQSKSRKWKTPRLRTPKTQHHLTIQRSLISDLLGVNIDCYFNAWGRTMTARRLIDAIQTKHWTLHISMSQHCTIYVQPISYFTSTRCSPSTLLDYTGCQFTEHCKAYPRFSSRCVASRSTTPPHVDTAGARCHTPADLGPIC